MNADERAADLRRRFEEANPATCPDPEGCTVRCPVGKLCYRHQRQKDRREEAEARMRRRRQ